MFLEGQCRQRVISGWTSDIFMFNRFILVQPNTFVRLNATILSGHNLLSVHSIAIQSDVNVGLVEMDCNTGIVILIACRDHVMDPII